LSDRIDDRQGFPSQLGIDGDGPTMVRTVVIDRAFRDRFADHFFEAQGLCGELYVIVSLLAPWSVFVFDRVGGAVTEKLDDIGATGQAMAFAEQRQRTFDVPVFVIGAADLIDSPMGVPAAQRVYVFGKALLLMDERALARAIAVVL
jgi:hypothetical protein